MSPVAGVSGYSRRVMRWRTLVVGLALLAVSGCRTPVTDGPPHPDSLPGRAFADRPDDTTGARVHVYYVLPADGADRRLDLDGSLARTVAAWNRWLAAQTGGPRLRVDTAGGALDITFARLPSTADEIAGEGIYARDRIERELRELGLVGGTELAAVYYDGVHHHRCGDGPLAPEWPGRVAAVYLDGRPPGQMPCNTNPLSADGVSTGYLEYLMLHEIFHGLGASAGCSPNFAGAGHTSDSPSDLMYAGDQLWTPSVLDERRDDYWGHGRAGCLDLARSAFLDPLPPAAELPPGW